MKKEWQIWNEYIVWVSDNEGKRGWNPLKNKNGEKYRENLINIIINVS